MPSLKKLFIISLAVGLAFSLEVKAQQIVNGIVVDSARFAPLPYVNIQIKHTLRGTITDHTGQFSITAQPSDTLVLSYIGYHTMEIPLYAWEASVVIMKESITVLNTVIIQDELPEDYYEMLFSERIQELQKANRKLPFYFSQGKKEKIKLHRFDNEQARVQTYVEVVINNPDTKASLMKKYSLTEPDYYATLTRFNEKYYRVMYYLSAPELLSLLNRFFRAD